MFTFQIDTASISESFNLTQQDVDQLLDFTVKEVTAHFAEQWEQEAIEQLKSSRQEYINSLVVVDEGPAQGAVVLVGKLPNMIESGVSEFDMKSGLLNGPNAKQGKEGKYNTIPFSFGTPGSLEENFNGGILPKEIYSLVKEKPTNEPLERYDLKNTHFKTPQKKKIKMPESKSFKDYQHRASIYEGVSKRKDAVTGQNTYGSFRRVSDKSLAESWIHPGIEAHNIAEKAMENFNLPQVVGRALDIFLARL